MVLPMVYDVTSNITQLAERRETSGVVPSTSTHAAGTILRRFAELHSAKNSGTDVCSILPAVRELLDNLVLPTDNVGQLTQQTPQVTFTSNSIVQIYKYNPFVLYRLPIIHLCLVKAVKWLHRLLNPAQQTHTQ